MNLASLFLSQVKANSDVDSLFSQMNPKEPQNTNQLPIKIGTPNNSSANTGFRRIKKENELMNVTPLDKNFYSKTENNANPFNQAMPQNMERILQMLSQRNNSSQMTPLSIFTSNNTNENINNEEFIKRTAPIFSSGQPLINTNPITVTENEINKTEKNVMLINELQNQIQNQNGNNQNKSNLLNKSLYVGILASLYNQINHKKQKEAKSNLASNLNLNNILNRVNLNQKSNFSDENNNNLNLLKKEISHSNEDCSDSECDSSEGNLKSKSKKIKKMNLSCGHYNREHYAKKLMQ